MIRLMIHLFDFQLSSFTRILEFLLLFLFLLKEIKQGKFHAPCISCKSAGLYSGSILKEGIWPLPLMELIFGRGLGKGKDSIPKIIC